MNLTKPALKMLVECAEAFGDIADKLTCSEADAIVRLYKDADMLPTAANIAEAHADGDDEGDRHWRERPKP
jgi:hypothetical protein